MSTTLSICRDLEQLDLIQDLDHRALHVTADRLSWERVRDDGFSRNQMLDLYYYMKLTRAVDQEIVKLSRKGLAFGKHLMCTGNEAAAVGASYALQEEDWAALGIRDLGAYLVRNVPISRILEQACGRSPGLTGGWDGSLHMGSPSKRIEGLMSHLGTMVAVATGCAFAQKYRAENNATLAFTGEGATSTGDIHEALNIASVLRLPLVLLIENNQWAFGTPTRLQYAVPTLALRSLAYGSKVEGYWIDGTDVLTVFETVRNALERARSERIITIIEAVSMRYEGHSLADPFKTYVPAEQLAKWKRKDPIHSYHNFLLERKVAESEELRHIDMRITKEVEEAALTAERSPFPDTHNIEARVFVLSEPCGAVIADPPAEGARITYHRAIHDALQEEMDRDPSLFMIGEDIGISNGAFKITEGFSKRYDQLDWNESWNTFGTFTQRRVIDAPIAEAGFCGLALGAARCGLRSVVEFQYADFASEGFKMIVNYAATQTARGFGPVPVVFRMPSGWATNTSMYHSVNPESWFASTPGLKIVAPITAFDAKGLLKAAIRDNNPVLYLEYKNHYRVPPERLPVELNIPVPDGDYIVPIGKARVLKSGRDLSVITYGSQVLRALDAAYEAEKQDGVSVEVVDLRSVAPYDKEAVLKSVQKTGRALVTCEAPRTGCFGATIVTEIIRSGFDFLDAPVMLVAAADTPVPFSPVLEEAHLPTTQKVLAGMRELLAY